MWRQNDYSEFRISIIEKGSEIYRCIPNIYLHGCTFYEDLLQKSFIQDSQGSLAFLIKWFGDGKRAYFSDLLENTRKEVHVKDSSNYVYLTCKVINSIHVVEAFSNSSLLKDLHDNKMVSNERLMQFKNDLSCIKRITDNNQGYIPTSVGYMPFHDSIEGVVFRSNEDPNCRTIMLFNADSLQLTQLQNSKNQIIGVDGFNEALYVDSDCSFKYNYSYLWDKQ